MRASTTAAHLAVDELLDDPKRRIIVCCGSGGVGKTTTAAALALRAAERGRRVVVLTIDPARRLAQAMGIDQLDNTPREVYGIQPGSLDAMMLDMKRTFDEVVITHASAEQAEQILSNPFYQAMSSSFAGTQEYMAMERLAQLHADTVGDNGSGKYDLIVVDTPPSRSALDFLDAPQRLSSFLDSKLLRLLAAPARGPLRFFSAGMGMVTGVLGKVLGAQVLRDIQTFVGSFDSTFGGFRERAERTYALLQQRGTAFLVVAAPEADALREASYFVDRLARDSMPLAGLVLNRQVATPARQLSAERSLSAAEVLGDTDPDEHQDVIALLDLHAARMRLAARQHRIAERFSASHPGVPIVSVPALATDVHDVETLRTIGSHLAE